MTAAPIVPDPTQAALTALRERYPAEADALLGAIAEYVGTGERGQRIVRHTAFWAAQGWTIEKAWAYVRAFEEE